MKESEVDNIDALWVEAFRPKKIKDMLLLDRVRKAVDKAIAKGSIDNLILVSRSPGTGKTSLAKAVAKSMDLDMKYVNVSEERTVDKLSEAVRGFASTCSLNDKHKLIILDEVDGLLKSAQTAFHAMTEELSSNCRFIMTLNNIHNLTKPLREGRFKVIEMDYTKPEDKEEMIPKIVERLVEICENKKVKADAEVLFKLAESCFPNIRMMISLLSKSMDFYDCLDARILKEVDETAKAEIVEFLLDKNLASARAKIISAGYDEFAVYKFLSEDFVSRIKPERRGKAYILIAKYDAQTQNSANPSVQMLACLYELIVECIV